MHVNKYELSLFVCAVPDMIMASTAKTLDIKASEVAQVWRCNR